MNDNLKRIGILGGSFDPVHLGHLMVAQDVMEQVGLDTVFFVPAAQAPLKPQEHRATPEQRREMLDLVLKDHPHFEVLDWELEEGGTSYSIQTAEKLREQWPDAEISWVIGADQLGQLHRWQEIEKMVACVQFVAVGRPGFSDSLARDIPNLRLQRVSAHALEMSSTEVRERLGKGLPVDFFLPPAVLEYIHAHKLYYS